MISPRLCAAEAVQALQGAPSNSARKSAETWLNELIWREFFQSILYHYPQVTRRSFMATMLNMPEEQATAFDSWPTLWRWLAPRLAEKADKQLLILDELSYASAADPALLSARQHAWDHHLKESKRQ